MRTSTILFLLALLAAACGNGMRPETAAPETDEQKTLYALGLAISRNLSPFNMSAGDLVYVTAGITDGVLKREPKVPLETFGPKIQELANARSAASAGAEKEASKDFLDKAVAEPGAVRTESGMVYREVTPGTGDSPKATDRVKVHYHGTLTDGTVFDSSVQRGEPATFPLNGVIKCWTEGVQKMKVGGKSRLVCPSDLAYGDRGSPPVIKPGATLAFDVELLEIVK